MKQETKVQDTVIRVEFKKGGFDTIQRKVLLDNNLSSDSKVLLTLLLNNVEDWKIRVNYFTSLLKWDKRKQARAISNLEEFGYLKVKRIPKGNKGFDYQYTISEYGDLNSETQKEEKQVPTAQPEATIEAKEEIKVPSKNLSLEEELALAQKKNVSDVNEEIEITPMELLKQNRSDLSSSTYLLLKDKVKKGMTVKELQKELELILE